MMRNPKPSYFIGTLSGTSMNSLDAGLFLFADEGCELVASHSVDYPSAIRTQIEAVILSRQINLVDLGVLDRQLGVAFGQLIVALLKSSKVSTDQVVAIGSHGQTLYHQPDGSSPFTLQIGDANQIVELTGIPTVADFRRADMAAGGQGAPLVVAFHQWLLGFCSQRRVVVNIGGISNISVLSVAPEDKILGFDTGPGNALLDCWTWEKKSWLLDEGGRWARSGNVDSRLLEAMLRCDYFQRKPPKSTGKELFNRDWLLSTLAQLPSTIAEVDVQRTLVELTAVTVSDAVRETAAGTEQLLVCGGGAKNDFLMDRLVALGDWSVETTAEYGIDPDWVEAACFAWLAKQNTLGIAGNLPAVTGANRPVVLGAYYRGSR